MPFRFNVFTGTLDLVGGGSGSGITGPSTSTDKAITRWNGTGGNVVQDGPGTLVQDSGAISAQAFITTRSITGSVTLNCDQVMITDSFTIEPTGELVINSDSEVVII